MFRRKLPPKNAPPQAEKTSASKVIKETESISTVSKNAKPAAQTSKDTTNKPSAQLKLAESKVIQSAEGEAKPTRSKAVNSSESKSAQSTAVTELKLANSTTGSRQTSTKSTSSTKLDSKPSTSTPAVTTDTVVFETFFHKDGTAYCCTYSNGIRYYLDEFKTRKWLEFPFIWYNEGLLVTNDIQTNGQEMNAPDQSRDNENITENLSNSTDEREGSIKLFKRGTFQTYIFEQKRNIHCYYDPDEAAWINLPPQWEIMTPLGKRLITKVQEILPHWTNEYEVMTFLRASNYSVDDCVITYAVTIGKDSESSAAPMKSRGSIIAATERAEALEQKHLVAMAQVQRLEEQLSTEKREMLYWKGKAHEFNEQFSSSSATLVNTKLQLDATRNARPKSAAPAKLKAIIHKSIKGLQIDLDAVRKDQIICKIEIQQWNERFNNQLVEITECSQQLKKLSSDSGDQIEEYRSLYRREALQRRLLFNQLQELRGNIRVFCRTRKDPRCSDACVVRKSEYEVEVTTNQGKKVFEFDHYFDTESKQDKIFAEMHAMISSCADGYNVCILAYGQTGSGKTHTMDGPKNDPGINVRAIKELLLLCEERKENVNFELKLSMVEIYNEIIQDLLSPKVEAVDIRSDGRKVNIPNLTEKEVRTVNDINNIMKLGTANRKVASTKMNSASSRSHLLVMLTVRGTDRISEVVTRGTLTMVDLAGSERVSKTEAQGDRLIEAAFINKSLSSLGQVFTALRTNQLHIPYRNSKLTHLLQPCLGGDAKAVLFVNISPSVTNVQESASTLQFGTNARQVALGPSRKNIERGPVPSF